MQSTVQCRRSFQFSFSFGTKSFLEEEGACPERALEPEIHCFGVRFVRVVLKCRPFLIFSVLLQIWLPIKRMNDVEEISSKELFGRGCRCDDAFQSFWSPGMILTSKISRKETSSIWKRRFIVRFCSRGPCYECDLMYVKIYQWQSQVRPNSAIILSLFEK